MSKANATMFSDLRRPHAYSHPVGDVCVEQTHASVVFLAGDFAYKLKKPVDLGFLDYSTLDKRRHYCQREVELNRRLAADVYLGVVPVVDGEGGLRIGEDSGAEDVVEWAVKMRRLAAKNTLRRRLVDRRIPPDLFDELGRFIASFHDEAKRGAEVDACASFEVVEKNALDNFSQTRVHIGEYIHPDVAKRLEECTRKRLRQLKPLIDGRADGGVARDTHGDLRLEHVYVDDDRCLRIVDCIEFNDAFRYADPVCDIAFLAMDLGFRGYDEEARQLLDAYFDEGDDDEGRELVDFYVAYRSCVRAKVHGFKADDEEVDEEDRARSRRKARAHWLYALARLEEPWRGPALTLVGGLPASGKSTLGRKMVEEDEADLVLDSDVVRKELAQMNPETSGKADFGEGIYTAEWTRRTYEELARRAGEALARGRRVVVAATFVDDSRRRQMIDTARRMGVPVRFIECRISDEEARRRLEARSGDASDADFEIYEKMKERWDEPSEEVRRIWVRRDPLLSK